MATLYNVLLLAVSSLFTSDSNVAIITHRAASCENKSASLFGYLQTETDFTGALI